MSKQVLCPFESDLDISGAATVHSSTKPSGLSCRNLKEKVRGRREEEHYGESLQQGVSYLAQSYP